MNAVNTPAPGTVDGAPFVRARDDRTDNGPRIRRRRQSERQPRLDDDGGRLCCSACRAPVTSTAQRSAQAGRHAHERMNPEGLVFRIGCFAAAPGCVIIGRPSSHWTWFPGFRWRVALCGRCGAHLGWHFGDGGGNGFFGLILDRLTDCDAQSGH